MGMAFVARNTWEMLRMEEDEEVAPAFGETWTAMVVRTGLAVFLFAASVGVLMVNSSSPFLYFQF